MIWGIPIIESCLALTLACLAALAGLAFRGQPLPLAATLLSAAACFFAYVLGVARAAKRQAEIDAARAQFDDLWQTLDDAKVGDDGVVEIEVFRVMDPRMRGTIRLSGPPGAVVKAGLRVKGAK